MNLIFPQKCTVAKRKEILYFANRTLGREIYNACLFSADINCDTKNKLNESICTLFAKI